MVTRQPIPKTELGRYQLSQTEGCEDARHLIIENLHRDADFWVAIEEPRLLGDRQENGFGFIGHIRFKKIAEGLFAVAELRSATDPLSPLVDEKRPDVVSVLVGTESHG